MKRFNGLIIIFILMMFLSSCVNNKQELVKAYPLGIDISLGWSLGNSLDACNKDLGYTYDTETIWNNPLCDKELIESVKSKGFDSIRIPVTYLNHIDENGVIDDRWLDRVEEIVNWCLEYNLYTIINVHHDASMNMNFNWIYADSDKYEENRERLVNLWKQIADRFRDYDERLLFQGSGEWVNMERNWDRSSSYDDFRIVHELNQDFIDTIRGSGGNNTNRYLMISPYSSSCEEDILEAMFDKGFDDVVKDRLILAVHSYQMDVGEIRKGAGVLANISNKYKIPVILDEFGFSIRNSKADNIKAMKAYHDASKDYGIGLIVWDDGYEYKVIDRLSGLISDIEFSKIYNLVQ